MTGIHSIAGFLYQINVTLYYLLVSILNRRFISCGIEIDVELRTGECKSMDLLLRQRRNLEQTIFIEVNKIPSHQRSTAQEEVAQLKRLDADIQKPITSQLPDIVGRMNNTVEEDYYYEVKDVSGLDEVSKIRPVINELYTVYTTAFEKIGWTYLVHSAPTAGDLIAFRNEQSKLDKITSYRRHHHEASKKKSLEEGLTADQKMKKKDEIKSQCRQHSETRTIEELESIKNFCDTFSAIYLPNTIDPHLRISDLELRIEELIGEIIRKMGRYETLNCREVRQALFDYVKTSIATASQELKESSKYASVKNSKRQVSIGLDQAFSGKSSLYDVFLSSNCFNDVLAIRVKLREEFIIPIDQLNLPAEF